ncbi:MAG TPA: type II toxin-antitoxin system VapC family toxin [Gemmataceae bacterium]|nr:type II toxin-antitoxin system VapC family toxin [Gemmataceae bacterium]
MTTQYLLDTNHLSDAIGKVSSLRDRIRHMRRLGHRFATCWPALLELEMGIAQTKNPEACRRILRILMKEVRLRPIDWDLLPIFGDIHIRLKRQGRVLSLVDKLLASMATREGAVILTSDKDFEALPEIRVENWLS